MAGRRRVSIWGVMAALVFISSGAGCLLQAQSAGVLTNLEIGSYKTPIEYLRFPLDQPISASRFDYTATVGMVHTAKVFITATTEANTGAELKINSKISFLTSGSPPLIPNHGEPKS